MRGPLGPFYPFGGENVAERKRRERKRKSTRIQNTYKKNTKKVVRRSRFQRDMERLENVNTLLMNMKGTIMYDQACEEAAEILKRVNDIDYN